MDNRVWPDDVVKASNNIANQFEVPVLFYALCLVLLPMLILAAWELAAGGTVAYVGFFTPWETGTLRSHLFT